jgi:predicted dehydrogenase
MAPAADLVAVCDANSESARDVATRFGVPRWYADAEEMLRMEQPDVVDICTPPRTHAPLTIMALGAGAHVLVEKPMAVGVEECDRMMAAADEAGKLICVAHSDLFYPSFRTMRNMVESGSIGRFRGMHIALSTPVDYITSRPDHWANKLPGGVLGETGPHVVYMTLAFINPIRYAYAHAAKLLPEYPWSPFEDYRIVLAGEENVGSVTLTYATNQWAAEVSVWGSAGSIRADLESQSVVHVDRTSLTPRSIAVSTLGAAAQSTGRSVYSGIRRLAGRQETTHEILIREFCRSIITGTAPPVPPQEGREAIRVMDLLAAQLDAGSTVTIQAD